MGVGTFFYMGINNRLNISEVNLYTLVPSGCNAVFETNNLALLLKEIKNADARETLPFSQLSRIINDIKTYYDKQQYTSASLIPAINKMLVSFHSPGTNLDQVVYLSTTPEDESLIEKQIEKNRPIDFPIKKVSYKDMIIRICPMGGDLFLCYYKSPGFIVASYSKKLIEQVIDAHIRGNSVLSDPVFTLSLNSKNPDKIASLHLKMKQMGWSELDIKFGRDAISLSGISMEADSSSSFINALKEQASIDFFPSNNFPRFTYYINEMACSHFQYIAENLSHQEYALTSYPDDVKQMDIHIMRYLQSHAANHLASISFYPEDTIHRPLSLLYIPVKDSIKAEKDLLLFIQKKISSQSKSQLLIAGAKTYRLYLLPRNTVFAQLSGINDIDFNSYAVFYKNRLLLAPDPASILSYINQMNSYNILKFDNPYNEYRTGMSTQFNYMLMADLAEVNSHPDSRSRFIPEFFFQYPDFFSHYVFITQLVCKDGMVSSKLTLTYK